MNNLPIGTIIAWENDTVPSGWAVCDGTNGTPDLRGRFIMGASVDDDIGDTGGSDTHIHTNTTTNTRTAHNHGGSATATVGPGGSDDSTSGTGLWTASGGHTHNAAFTITSANSHSHTVGNTDSKSNLPKHIVRAFIKRIS